MKVALYLIVLSTFIGSCHQGNDFCPNTCEELAVELLSLKNKSRMNGVGKLDIVKNSRCYSCVNEQSLLGVTPSFFSLIFNDRLDDGRSIAFDSLLLDINMVSLDAKLSAGVKMQCTSVKEMQLSYIKHVDVDDTVVLSLPITEDVDSVSFPLISCLGKSKVRSWFRITGTVEKNIMDSTKVEGFDIKVLDFDYPAKIAGQPLKKLSTFRINFKEQLAYVYVKA